MTESTATTPTQDVPVEDVTGFFQHGWHSWCETRWVAPPMSRRPIESEEDRLGHDDPAHAFDELPGGSGFGAVEHADGRITLLGALAGGAWVGLEADRLSGRYEAGSGPWVTLTGDEQQVFSRYAELLAENLGRRGGTPPRLWVSWYSYYEEVTERIMHEVVAGLEGLELDVIQVDDGWERAIGDWEPNDSFPSGMADMASRIRSTGRRAGLWLAPFIAMPDSQLVAERPELVLRDASGDPVVAGVNWGGPYWALDVTRQDTLEHLTRLFSHYRRAGYDFFKLDFVYAAAFPGEHAYPMPRSEAYRNACLRIREAVGDDTYLLACGAPMIESIGVFDGIRIGPDVGPVWEDGTYASAHRAMITAVHRLWLRSAIDPDPDVVYFRTTELNPQTQRHLQAMARITGFRATSDPPDWLTGPQRAALAEFLADQSRPEQLSRYRWQLDGESVDFAPVLTAQVDEPRWQEAG